MADKNNLENYIENAPDPAPKVEGEVKEEQSEQEVAEVKTPTSYGEEDVDGSKIVKKLMRDAGIAVEGGTEEAAEKDGSKLDIPDEFTDVAIAQGWTEKEIIDFADGIDNEMLLALIPQMVEDFDEPEVKSDTQKNLEAGSSKKEPPEKTAEPANAEVAALKKDIAELKEQLKKDKEEKDAQEDAAILDAINQKFDEVGKEFKIFGKTDEILKYPAGPRKGQYVSTSPEMKARNEVFAKAYPFIQAGLSVEEAMDIALTWYKGKNLEQEVHRKVIKDLKGRESKLSAKRSGKETVKVYEDEEERKAAVVREAAKRAGVKGEFRPD
jgi:hypothetical protein